MGNPAKDLTGQRFGYLTVIERNGTSTGKVQKARWLCKCDCGNTVTRESQYLRSKHRTTPRSCGCHHGNETHKMSYTPLFSVWTGMKRRCLQPKDKDWHNYGARGITVCERWRDSFENFYADLHEGYQKGLTLDRIDVNGPYSPENCRWATPEQQGNNTRTNVFIDTPKGRMTVSQAARAFGVKVVTLQARLWRYGWSVERALFEPVHPRKSSTLRTQDQGTGSLS